MENSRRFLIENPDIALELEEKILTKLGVNGRVSDEQKAADAAAAAAAVTPVADAAAGKKLAASA